MEFEHNNFDGKNRQHGHWELYNPDGSLRYVGRFVHGERDGYWEYYWVTGKLHWTGFYIKGRMVGVWDYYNAGGEFKMINYIIS